MKSKTRENYDFKLLSKECWNILHRKYGGFEIKRYKDNEYYSRKFIIKFPAVNTLFHIHILLDPYIIDATI